MADTTRTFFYESELHRLRAGALVALGSDRGRIRDALATAAAAVARLNSPPLRLRVAVQRLRLELDHGDPVPHRREVEGLWRPIRRRLRFPTGSGT